MEYGPLYSSSAYRVQCDLLRHQIIVVFVAYILYVSIPVTNFIEFNFSFAMVNQIIASVCMLVSCYCLVLLD